MAQLGAVAVGIVSPELGQRAGSSCREQAAKAAEQLAAMAAYRAELHLALEEACTGLMYGARPVDVVGDLRARLDRLGSRAPTVYVPPAERVPSLQVDPTGDRGLSGAMTVHTDEWYTSTAWFREEAEMAREEAERRCA